ncbi:hypothetical protein GA0004736_2583 [Curtobacterium sp. 9128]|uniref:hypothetical protein n=1 Tax=Curtobacterium sp. 9128 TaxID=1793722 RepID=UPI0007D72498|nr:hypothetical protein [Curtobacterium sp. 9128]SBN63646.1 hypothetical protein GA0004736_2583 [Curtobacterium sp. 9128]
MLKRKPLDVPTDPFERRAFANGATPEEWAEFHRTNIITVSMRVKWWLRRTLHVLR